MSTTFAELKPAGWSESFKETLSAIKEEGEWHITELMLSNEIHGDAHCVFYETDSELAVAKLRARAVVLAAEVERLMEERS